jgi:acetyl-CoA/propionyl-CoA carboxylase biotin carboxyl carrier protein
MFKRILIANRGEIALRVIRTAREMGIECVAVYSDLDAQALHTRMAHRAVALGGVTPAETYLNVDKILAAAKETGAEAIHPGYGFLSENAGFAHAVTEAGLAWIGPPPEAIEVMGDKIESRRAMQAAGVPCVPGLTDSVADPASAIEAAEAIGYPVPSRPLLVGAARAFESCARRKRWRALSEPLQGKRYPLSVTGVCTSNVTSIVHATSKFRSCLMPRVGA